MKKIMVFLLGLFLVIGFVGCNGDGSELDIDMKEFIDYPQNLTISNTTLSWDAVENASGYVVYADGEEVDKVNETSFDFSDLDGDVIIFQVQTRAPRGYEDSALSAKIAYVEDKEEEITAVGVAFQEAGMFMPQEFAEELVNKGMLASDVESMVGEMEDFSDVMDSVNNFEDFIDALRELIESAENYEALVSALVKTMLPTLLEEQIMELEDQVDYYEEMIERYYYNEDFYQTQIDMLEESIDMMEELLDEIEDNPDQIVLAITSTIDYFVSVQEMISEDFIDAIDSLTETEEPSDLNVSELVLVKEELVNILRETMPTEEDMVLLMQVSELLTTAAGSTVATSEEVENYTGKLAAQALYTMEAFVNFLDGLDEDFFNELKTEMTTNESEEMIAAEVAILMITYFDTFLDENEDLLDTIAETFTDEEKEAMFNDSINSLDDFNTGQTEMIVSVFEDLSFQEILNLQIVLEDSFADVLDAFVAQDGEFLRKVAISNGYRSYPEFQNEVTGDTFDNYTEYMHDRHMCDLDVMEYAVPLVNALVQSMDEESSELLLGLVFDSVVSTLFINLSMMTDFSSTEMPFSSSDLESAFDVVETAITSVNADMLELVQNAFNYIENEEVVNSVQLLKQDVHEYLADEYGDNYRDGYEWYNDEAVDYSNLILALSFYDDFMNNANNGLVDDIVTVIIDTLKDDDVQALTELTDADVDDVETLIEDVRDTLDDYAGDISSLDWSNLSASDIEDIEAFMTDIEALFDSFYETEMR